MSELQMCAVRRNTPNGGSWIETGREFRAASSKIYSSWTDEGREECWSSVDVKGTSVWRGRCESRNIERILDSLRYGNSQEDLYNSNRRSFEFARQATFVVFLYEMPWISCESYFSS